MNFPMLGLFIKYKPDGIRLPFLIFFSGFAFHAGPQVFIGSGDLHLEDRLDAGVIIIAQATQGFHPDNIQFAVGHNKLILDVHRQDLSEVHKRLSKPASRRASPTRLSSAQR